MIDAEVNINSGATDTPCSRVSGKPVSGPCSQVALTVAQQAAFITLGTGNTILEPSPTLFHMPFVALVTDANGNPVPNVVVELNLIALKYWKGQFTALYDPVTLAFQRWVQASSIQCDNEDINRNGILDPSEDINGNGKLEPGNVVSIPGSVTTDANGFAAFNVEYPQNYNLWAKVELEGRATVSGSEASKTTTFVLKALAADMENEKQEPPGFFSPFGIGSSCTDPD